MTVTKQELISSITDLNNSMIQVANLLNKMNGDNGNYNAVIDGYISAVDEKFEYTPQELSVIIQEFHDKAIKNLNEVNE